MSELGRSLRITGGRTLSGTVRVAGSKNATLPIMAASLMCSAPVELRNVPDLTDTSVMSAILSLLGADVSGADRGVMRILPPEPAGHEVPDDLGRRMRASVLLMGPLLARTGRVRLPRPGGDDIGMRRIEQHINGLRTMGAGIWETPTEIIGTVNGRLRGCDVVLDMPTVTGTENLIMAATLAEGRTHVINAAREPHVQDLCRFLNAAGARITGAGSDVITIDGVDSLDRPVRHEIVSDYLEAGTYAIAVAATGGEVRIERMPEPDLPVTLLKLRQAGVELESEGDALWVRRPAGFPLRGVDLTTWVHPGFPTDLQAQYMVLMTQAAGESVISEFLFENRFQHVPYLRRMGAAIELMGRTAFVVGPNRLTGTEVTVPDIRSGAALVMAALCAEGESHLSNAWHVDRGYEDMPGRLRALGAEVEVVVDPAPPGPPTAGYE